MGPTVSSEESPDTPDSPPDTVLSEESPDTDLSEESPDTDLLPVPGPLPPPGPVRLSPPRNKLEAYPHTQGIKQMMQSISCNNYHSEMVSPPFPPMTSYLQHCLAGNRRKPKMSQNPR